MSSPSPPPAAALARLLIFDDGRGAFGPLTDLRAAFELRSGAVTSRERVERVLGVRAAALVVPPALAPLIADRTSDALVNELPPMQSPDEAWLAVNGRWAGVAHVERVAQLPADTALVQVDGQIVAARLARRALDALLAAGDWLVPSGVAVAHLREPALLARPWHIQDQLDAALKADLAATAVPATAAMRERGPRHGPFVQFGEFPLHLSQHATVQPTVVFNTEQGPVVVEYDALIGAGAVIEGPAYIGHGAQVTCHTHVRPNTVVGPMCKVGGEISHSVLFGHTNKAHAGYLGHALVGEWVNLGAQTNVSNLKNTYGPIAVQVERDQPAENTGRMYLGPVIGDYVRTAIGTRILTGSVVGTGAMLALSGFAPKFVERFAFLTDKGPEHYEIDKFIETANRMMSRRDMALSAAEEARLRTLAGA